MFSMANALKSPLVKKSSKLLSISIHAISIQTLIAPSQDSALTNHVLELP